MRDHGAPSHSPTVERQPPREILTLSDDECREVLRRQRMCVLSVVDGDEPYAVPVFYGFDGVALYVGVAEGRKTRALDVNARVYITVAEVGPGNAWRSVAIAGIARTLADPTERQRAIEVMIAHNRQFRQPGVDPPPRRPAAGRMLRIEQAVMSGRAFAQRT